MVHLLHAAETLMKKMGNLQGVGRHQGLLLQCVRPENWAVQAGAASTGFDLHAVQPMMKDVDLVRGQHFLLFGPNYQQQDMNE